MQEVCIQKNINLITKNLKANQSRRHTLTFINMQIKVMIAQKG